MTPFPPIRVDRTLLSLLNFNALSPPKGNQYLSITGSSPISSWALWSILTTFCESVTTFPPIKVDGTLSYLRNFNALLSPKGNQYLSITGSSPITSWALWSILTTSCKSVTSFPPIRVGKTLSSLLNFNALSPPKKNYYLNSRVSTASHVF